MITFYAHVVEKALEKKTLRRSTWPPYIHLTDLKHCLPLSSSFPVPLFRMFSFPSASQSSPSSAWSLPPPPVLSALCAAFTAPLEFLLCHLPFIVFCTGEMAWCGLDQSYYVTFCFQQDCSLRLTLFLSVFSYWLMGSSVNDYSRGLIVQRLWFLSVKALLMLA